MWHRHTFYAMAKVLLLLPWKVDHWPAKPVALGKWSGEIRTAMCVVCFLPHYRKELRQGRASLQADREVMALLKQVLSLAICVTQVQ